MRFRVAFSLRRRGLRGGFEPAGGPSPTRPDGDGSWVMVPDPSGRFVEQGDATIMLLGVKRSDEQRGEVGMRSIPGSRTQVALLGLVITRRLRKRVEGPETDNGIAVRREDAERARVDRLTGPGAIGERTEQERP